jgi:hypothetical protein
MPGGGEVIPNGSIHWNIVHEDAAGQPKPRGGLGPLQNDPDDVVAIDDSVVHGKDPTPVAQIGDRKGHRGKFRVKLRFGTEMDALKAIQQAATTLALDSNTEMYEMTLDVRAIGRSEAEAGARPPNAFAQMRIDW